MKALGGQVCQICGDNVGKGVDGEPFVACNVCAFPVCRPCYEYEQKDGNQSCPQCKARYKRQKGWCLWRILSPRHSYHSEKWSVDELIIMNDNVEFKLAIACLPVPLCIISHLKRA